MRTKLFSVFAISLSTLFFSQQNKGNKQTAEDNEVKKNYSQTRSFIENADITRTNKDWSQIAEFRSGTGETVQFFPVQIVNLKSGQKRNALELDMEIKIKNAGVGLGILGAASGIAGGITGNQSAVFSGSNLMAQAITNDGKLQVWVDNDEVQEFIKFLEDFIIPDISTKYKKKSSEFVFRADEITFIFLINESKKRLTIKINDMPDYSFWTESRAEKIGDLIPVLKMVNSKELDF